MTDKETQKAAGVADKLLGVAKCPNCGSPVVGHPDDMCILHALITIVGERGNKSNEELQKLHADSNVDAFWDAVGAVIYDLENGVFSR